MNRTLILLLAVCLISVHAFVKRDAPAEENALDKLNKQVSKTFDPETVKKRFSDMVEAVNKVSNALVIRDAPSTDKPNVLASFQKNMDHFRRCLDQSLAMAADDVNENQLKPVFTVLGDTVSRFSKAFEDLTATTKKPDPDLDF